MKEHGKALTYLVYVGQLGLDLIMMGRLGLFRRPGARPLSRRHDLLEVLQTDCHEGCKETGCGQAGADFLFEACLKEMEHIIV